VPGGELGQRVAAASGVQVGLMQVRAQQCEQGAGLGEVSARAAEQEQPQGRPGPGVLPGSAGRVSISSWSIPCGW
jgi:hypothetical protein